MSRVQMVQKDQAQSAVKELYNRIEENGASVFYLSIWYTMKINH